MADYVSSACRDCGHLQVGYPMWSRPTAEIADFRCGWGRIFGKNLPEKCGHFCRGTHGQVEAEGGARHG